MSANIWVAASDNDIASVARFLSNDPVSVNARDSNGYTPIHAAASYNHIALLKSLVGTHNGNPNITDHDGDTPLFFVETVETARCLVEELGADPSLKNNSGLTAADAIEEDGQFPLVVAYLREQLGEQCQESAVSSEPGRIAQTPEGMELSYSTMEEPSDADALIDMGLRKKIEELSQREDFQSNAVQQELRDLVTSTIQGQLLELEVERNVKARQDDKQP